MTLRRLLVSLALSVVALGFVSFFSRAYSSATSLSHGPSPPGSLAAVQNALMVSSAESCVPSDHFYLHPAPSGKALSRNALSHRTVYVFIHVNKAGGTLLKEDVFKPAAIAHKWDGGGYGTVEVHSLDANCRHSVENAGLACGKIVPLTRCGPIGGGKCPTRAVWGNLALDQCANRTQPCVQVIVLREPVSRLVSQYNYVCVDGREDRKKWLASWKAADKCPLSLEEFLLSPSLTTPSLMVKRLVGIGGDPNSECALEQAKRNLIHPCVRFLLLDRLSDGLKRLSTAWGTAMEPFLRRASRDDKRNASPYPPRTIAQMENAAMMKRIRIRLQNDIKLYEFAQQMYEEQWKY